jgi:hypothetical protein
MNFSISSGLQNAYNVATNANQGPNQGNFGVLGLPAANNPVPSGSLNTAGRYAGTTWTVPQTTFVGNPPVSSTQNIQTVIPASQEALPCENWGIGNGANYIQKNDAVIPQASLNLWNQVCNMPLGRI